MEDPKVDLRKCPVCQNPAACVQDGPLIIQVPCTACGGLRRYPYVIVQYTLPGLPPQSRTHLQAALRRLPNPLNVVITSDMIRDLILYGDETPPDLFGPTSG